MANENLSKAKSAKNDEFYTQYHDIENEINAYLDYDPDVFRGKTVLLPCDADWSQFMLFFAQKFHTLGLKKLGATCIAPASVGGAITHEPTRRVAESARYDEALSRTRGMMFTLDRDVDGDGIIDHKDIEWQYLEGDGDFRSDEVTRLRDQADIIVTNPPFSLFRVFMAWLIEAQKRFLIIGNMNAITYKEVFPLIKDNLVWLGATIHSGDREFEVPEEYPLEAAGWRIDEKGNKYICVKGVRWFANIDHGLRHQPLQLMTKAQNLRFSKHDDLRGKTEYDHYDNYDAIEVPYTDVIPSDYEGIMGVPISFLDKYCPEQFEILGITQRNDDPHKTKKYTTEQYSNANDLNARGVIIKDGVPKSMYARILIRKIKQ